MSVIKNILEELPYYKVKELNSIAPRKLGIKKRQWQNLISGVSKPTSDKLPILAKLLNCSIEDLIMCNNEKISSDE